MTAYFAIQLTHTASKTAFRKDWHNHRVPADAQGHSLGDLSIKTSVDVGVHVPASSRYLGMRVTPAYGRVFDFLLATDAPLSRIVSLSYQSTPNHSGPVCLDYSFLAVDNLTPGSLAGVVLNDNGDGVTGAVVTVSKGAFTKSATSGALGVYAITGIPVAEGYSATASKSLFVSETKTTIEILEDDETEVDFDLDRFAKVSGVTMDQATTPIPGAAVSLTQGATVYTTESAAVTGAFEFDVPPYTGNVLEASAVLHVDAEEIFDLVAAQELVQNLTLSQYGAISGTTSDEDGVLPGVTVNVYAEGDDEDILYTTESAVDGTWSVLNVAPGDYDIHHVLENYVTEILGSVAVVAATVTTDQDAELGKYAVVIGNIVDQAVDPLPGAIVGIYVSYPGVPVQTAESDVAGDYAFSLPVAPGTYQIRASGAGYGDMFEMDYVLAANAVATINFKLTLI